MGLGDSIGTGRKTVTTAGTAVVLKAATKCTSVCITAETDNTGIICVGSSDVIASLSTRTGIPLYPGDTITIPTIDLDQVWIDATVNGEGVTFAWVNDVRR